jgi:hypothetical protein
MLRSRADSSRDDSVWVEDRHCVHNSDVVHILRNNAESEQGFAWIRTRDGHEGFIQSELLRVRPTPSSTISQATIHRQDGEASTMLRQVPRLSREWGVWVKGHHVRLLGAIVSARIPLNINIYIYIYTYIHIYIHTAIAFNFRCPNMYI